MQCNIMGFRLLKLICFGIISVLAVSCADLDKGLKNCSTEFAYQKGMADFLSSIKPNAIPERCNLTKEYSIADYVSDYQNGFDASDKMNCNQGKALEVALSKSKFSNDVNLDFTGHFCENSKHYPFEKYKKDYTGLFKKEFCKMERIKEIAKYDAQDFILKKSKSNFNVCNDQIFYSVYLKKYSESIKSSCSSMGVISKKGRSFAQNNRKINEGHELIKAICPRNLVKNATRFFTLAYLSSTANHSYKNNVESQGVLSTKEEALLLEKIKLDREKKQEAFQQKIQDSLPNSQRDGYK